MPIFLKAFLFISTLVVSQVAKAQWPLAEEKKQKTWFEASGDFYNDKIQYPLLIVSPFIGVTNLTLLARANYGDHKLSDSTANWIRWSQAAILLPYGSIFVNHVLGWDFSGAPLLGAAVFAALGYFLADAAVKGSRAATVGSAAIPVGVPIVCTTLFFSQEWHF